MREQLKVTVANSETKDGGKVRIGNMSPSFPAVRTSSAETADSGKVRLGNMSPAL